MRVAFVGECMFEMSTVHDPVDHTKMRFGGDTVNTAVYFSRRVKGSDIGVYYATRLGEQMRDNVLISTLEDEGICCGLIERVTGGKTGSYTIHVAVDGERNFSYDRSHTPARELFSDRENSLLTQLENFDVLYVTGITLAILSPIGRQRLIKLMKNMKSGGKRVVYDSNHRPSLWEDEKTAQDVHMAAFQACNMALPSYEDLQLIFGHHSKKSFLHKLKKMNISLLVLKDGYRNVMVQTVDRVEIFKLQKVTAPRDTTAAGDGFNAGFLAVMLSGGSLPDAILSGHRLAAQIIMYPGAIIPEIAL